MNKIYCLIIGFGISLSCFAVDGFWNRYSSRKLPAESIVVDSALIKFRAEEQAKNNKKVRMLYNVDFATFFDNREYHGPYQIPQTIFSLRLSPTIGLGVRDALGGRHSLIAGLHYTQPLGGNWQDAKVDPTAYYQYQYKGFDLNMGAIPYTNRYAVLPDWLMYDSIVYNHPNMLGALLAYHDHRGFVEFMCDWRGFQTPTRREMFRLILDGQYRYKWFFIGGWGQINHKAGFMPPHEYEGVCDDIYVSPFVGFNVSSYTPLDSLTIRASYILGIQQHRSQNIALYPQGFSLELYANWWFLGIKNTFYYGQNLMPFYGEFGVSLNQGDPFYQSHIYNRTDIFAYLYRSSFVNFYFSWNLHYDGHSLANQQQLIVRFSLDGLKKEQPLLGLFDK